MARDRGNAQISRRGNDTLDRLFEWVEGALCPSSMRNYKAEPREDTLDYVFEHVESFACRQEDEKEPDVMYAEHEIKRDNSLVEADQEGHPMAMATQRQIRPLGQQGDALDYVFEHAESYLCNEDMPDDSAMHRSMMAPTTVTPERNEREDYRAAKNRLENVYDPEDEIQLYFRPQRGRRRRQKNSKKSEV